MLKKKHKKVGRKMTDRQPVNVSIPIEMIDYVKGLGHNSPSLGMRLMWEEIVKPIVDAQKAGKEVKIISR